MYFSHIYNLFQIRPPIQPLNKIDVGKIQLNFGVFTVKYIYYNRSGNDLQTINLIGAMASTFERVPYVSTLKCGTSISCVLNSFCLLHKVILFLYFFLSFVLFLSSFSLFLIQTDESTTEEDVMRGIDHLHVDNSLNEPIFIAYREVRLFLQLSEH